MFRQVVHSAITNPTTGARSARSPLRRPSAATIFKYPRGTRRLRAQRSRERSTVTVLAQSIASGTNSPLNLTLDGIVASINTTVAPATLLAMPTGTPVTATVSVNALDQYGNVIMGSGNWVDASGNMLTVNVQPTSPANGGPVLTSPNVLTAVTPAAPTFSVSYPGGSTWGTTFAPTVTGDNRR